MSDNLLQTLKMYQYDLKRAGCLSWVGNAKQRIFLASSARQKILFGGTRSGKSDCCMVDISLLALGVKGLFYPGFAADGEGVDVWCSALDRNKWRDTLIPKLRTMLGPFIRKYNSTDGIFYLTNGRTITMKTNESGFEKFQSSVAPVVLFDEYPPEDIYKECVMRTAEAQGCVLVAATPTRGTGWLSEKKYDEWFSGTNGELRSHNGMIFISLHTEDNKNIPATVVEDIKREYKDPDELEARLHGKHFVPGGLVFRNFEYDRHVVKPFVIPDDWIRIRGFDWGIRSPAACVWMALDPVEKVWYAYREWYKKEMGVPRICAEVLSMSGAETYLYNVLDPSCWNRKTENEETGGWMDTAQEYVANGIYVSKANNAWSQGINRVIQLFGWAPQKPRLLIFEECVNLIREVSKYPWPEVKRDGSGNKLPEKASKAPDHALDCLRYSIMSLPEQDDYSPVMQPGLATTDMHPEPMGRTFVMAPTKREDGSLVLTPQIFRGGDDSDDY